MLTTHKPAPADHPDTPLLAWRDGAIARLHFNRPAALNAIDRAMARAFDEACQRVVSDPAVRVVCLSGEGRAFVAGGDLPQMREDPLGAPQALIAGLHGGIRTLAGFDAPLVASVHGAVAGGGLGLMMSCDLVIAAEGTKFSVAYAAIGASCDCSTSWGLPRVVGLRKAMQLALLNEPVGSDEALRLGLVNRVVPADRLGAETDALLQRLASGPTRAFGQMKRLMRQSFDHTLEQQLDAEAAGFQACAKTADFGEGVGAFLERRKPAFRGE